LRSARARQRWFNPGDLQNQFPAQQAATASAATRVFEPGGDGHELARGIRLAGQWGGDVRRKPPAIHLDSFASDEAYEQYARWQRGLRFEIPGDELRINVGDEAMAGPTASSPIIGLMPASALPVKGYPLSAWATVVRQLWHEEGLVCALLGGPDDQAQVDALASQLGSVPYLRLSRPLDVLAMAALVRRLDGLLSVDTGLAHLAIAQNVPAVILRSGAHPGRFFPWPGNHEAIVLSHAMPCEGCACRCHLSEAECLTRIEPGDVVLAARRLFTKPRQSKIAV
jgi:ADP-heptose:LPS heptosyltransferase